MLRNYIRTALRSMKKHWVDALINMVGLALGMACFMVIMSFVFTELSFDRYHSNADL